jgi:hypothetical protein
VLTTCPFGPRADRDWALNETSNDPKSSTLPALAGDQESGRDAALAELLSDLERNGFIPAAALGVVAEIVSFLHGNDSETAEPEIES